MSDSQGPTPGQSGSESDGSAGSRQGMDPSGVLNAPPPPPPGAYGWGAPPQGRGGGSGRGGGVLTRVLTGVITSVLLLSLIFNIYAYAYFSASIAGPSELTYQDGDGQTPERIAILPIQGMITDDMAGFVHGALKKLDENPPAALILRVASGGGGVGASDRIWNELRDFRERHGVPIVASFGSLAASGGYYVSAAADHIVIEPTGVTGSIGVIAQAFTIGEMLDKVGVTPETLTATGSPRKDVANDIMRSWNDEDRAVLRKLLDTMHRRFKSIVAEGRADHLSDEQVDAVTRGDIYTDEEALAVGLVDDIGYLSAAIDKAKSLAGMSEDAQPRVTRLAPQRSLNLLSMVSASPAPTGLHGLDAGQVRQWLVELSTPQLEYRIAP